MADHHGALTYIKGLVQEVGTVVLSTHPDPYKKKNVILDLGDVAADRRDLVGRHRYTWPIDIVLSTNNKTTLSDYEELLRRVDHLLSVLQPHVGEEGEYDLLQLERGKWGRGKFTRSKAGGGASYDRGQGGGEMSWFSVQVRVRWVQ